MPGADVIENSLKMVRQASAYVLLIGHRYGQRPDCASRNPNRLSITEIEFNEALRLGRPVQLYLLSKEYPVAAQFIDVETSDRESLAAFRERAKLKNGVGRIYTEVRNKREFETAAATSMLALKQSLENSLLVKPSQVDSRRGGESGVLERHAIAVVPSGSSTTSPELGSFQRAMAALFGKSAPLAEWCQNQGWSGELPPSIADAMSDDLPMHEITSLFVRDVIGALKSDLESKELVLADNKDKIRKRLNDCMSAALALSMEPLQRRELLRSRDVLNVPAKTPIGADVAARPDALQGIVRSGAGWAHKHSIETPIELGEGNDRRWGILAHFASMVSSLNSEGATIRIDSEEEAEGWGGKLRAEALLGNQRILVISGSTRSDQALSAVDISWLAGKGVKTAVLAGEGEARFWHSDEPLVVGIVESFKAFEESLLK